MWVSISVVVTFAEETYYSWSAVECGKHESDPTVLADMRDCLDSWIVS